MTALALVEFRSVAHGLEAVDTLMKTYPLNLESVKVVCPGKLVAIVAGNIGAVASAIDGVRGEHRWTYIRSLVLGRAHQDLLPAIVGTTAIGVPESLGILEAWSAGGALQAADTALKSSPVKVVRIHLASGLSGRALVLMTGAVAAVEMALEKAAQTLGEDELAHAEIIPSPDELTWQAVL